jgi:hypothetical protein
MTDYQIEVIKRTFFWVTAKDKESAKQIALEWAMNGEHDAVVDNEGGLEIGDIADVAPDGTLTWRTSGDQ